MRPVLCRPPGGGKGGRLNASQMNGAEGEIFREEEDVIAQFLVGACISFIIILSLIGPLCRESQLCAP